MSVERELIERYFLRRSGRNDVTLGIGDDAAVTRVREGFELVSAVDTILAGVHFPPTIEPAAIGYRALAVNLSDLAAMGAEPAWALMSLSCERTDAAWFEAFAAGFFALASKAGVELIGGDLVRGPLAVSVTVLGQLPRGSAILRGGACAGDLLHVTGALGCAAAGLTSLLDGLGDSAAEQAFLRPQPRNVAGIALRGLASAAIDLSDGLVGDAAHLARNSKVGIEIDPQAVTRIAAGGDVVRALRGGDDYELLFTIAPDRLAELRARAGNFECEITAIGKVVQGQGVTVPGYDTEALRGYDHFDA